MKLFFGLLCACICLFTAIHVSAEEVFVYDHADLLSVDEENFLQEYSEELSKNLGMNFLVVTTDDAHGKSSMEYADDFYDAKYPEDSQEDGVLYLIDMDNREIYISTSGRAIRYLTDERIERILDAAYGYVVEEDYFSAFTALFDKTKDYLVQEPMKLTLGEVFIALAGALIPAAVTMGIIKGRYQLKFEDFRYDAYTDSEVILSVKSDRMVNKFVTHRRIPKNNGSSGGGSTTHHSSSGRSHGGGGRKF